MKKRVLSLLLMLVMLVSAVPMLVFPASAADTEANYDYSSLYVTDGATLMVDFFKTNEIWLAEGAKETTAFPTSPVYGEDYANIDDRMDFWIEDAEGNVIGDEDMLLADARAALVELLHSEDAAEKGYALKSAYSPDYAEFIAEGQSERIRFWLSGPSGNHADANGTVYYTTIQEASAAATQLAASTGDTYSIKSEWITTHANILGTYAKNVNAWLKQNTYLGKLNEWSAPQPANTLGQTWRDETGEYGFAPFNPKGGALEFMPYGHSDAYIGLGGGDIAPETTMTVQYVMTPGYTFQNRFFMIRGVELKAEAVYSAEGDQILFKGTDKYNSINGTTFANPASIPLDNSKPMDVTLSVTHAATAKDDEGNSRTGDLQMWYNGESKLDETFTYNADVPANHRLTLISYGRVTSASYYAIRMYNRTLTDDEMTLNHFADIAKWYKLDIGAIVSLTTEKKLAIAEEFDTDVIGGSFAEREVLAAKLRGIVDEVVYGALAEGIAQPTANCNAFGLP